MEESFKMPSDEEVRRWSRLLSDEIPLIAHAGYAEGYLQALKKIAEHVKNHPEMPFEDFLFIMRISITTRITDGYSRFQEDLSAFPETKRLLEKGPVRYRWDED